MSDGRKPTASPPRPVDGKTAKRGPESPPGGRSSQRREQARSVEKRVAILDAALSEFAERGYEAASTRNIARRAGIHNTLLTYHFRGKEALWKATAEHFFGEISSKLGRATSDDSNLAPLERLRTEFRSFFTFIIAHPSFHQFMMRENQPGSARLPWLMETLLAPIMRRTIPIIEAAQRSGDLPPGHPVLIYYFLVSVTTVLSTLSAEIEFHSGVEPLSSAMAERYWDLVERVIFDRAKTERA